MHRRGAITSEVTPATAWGSASLVTRTPRLTPVSQRSMTDSPRCSFSRELRAAEPGNLGCLAVARATILTIVGVPKFLVPGPKGLHAYLVQLVSAVIAVGLAVFAYETGHALDLFQTALQGVAVGGGITSTVAVAKAASRGTTPPLPPTK